MLPQLCNSSATCFHKQSTSGPREDAAGNWQLSQALPDLVDSANSHTNSTDETVPLIYGSKGSLDLHAGTRAFLEKNLRSVWDMDETVPLIYGSKGSLDLHAGTRAFLEKNLRSVWDMVAFFIRNTCAKVVKWFFQLVCLKSNLLINSFKGKKLIPEEASSSSKTVRTDNSITVKVTFSISDLSNWEAMAGTY
ncbi:hypothetical protein Nmel_008453 [Mimus melanotis]